MADDKVLVVIQLDGGNDGLNTVVPYADDEYGRARNKLRLPTDRLHKLNVHLGLHPAMAAAKELYDDGRFSIIQGVGYPNPDRSHFRSMNIWQTASLDDEKHDGEGWLGRTLDGQTMNGPKNAIYVGNQETPVALWGRKSESISLSRAEDLQLAIETNLTDASPSSTDATIESFVTKQVLSAYASADEFKRQKNTSGGSGNAGYPQTKLGSQLELISKILKSGSRTRIFYTIQNGYDTHSTQLYDHAQLLKEYSDAVKSFLDDLKAAGLDDRVVVMTFSEFGRRIHENGSEGTDHGTAGPVFLAGAGLKGGLIGEAPNFSDVKDGDLAVQQDFRSVYATILDTWLNVEPRAVLGDDFEKLPLFS